MTSSTFRVYITTSPSTPQTCLERSAQNARKGTEIPHTRHLTQSLTTEHSHHVFHGTLSLSYTLSFRLKTPLHWSGPVHGSNSRCCPRCGCHQTELPSDARGHRQTRTELPSACQDPQSQSEHSPKQSSYMPQLSITTDDGGHQTPSWRRAATSKVGSIHFVGN